MKFTGTHWTILICVVTVCMTSLLLTGRIVISPHVVESFLVAIAGFVSYLVGLLQRQPTWVDRVVRRPPSDDGGTP